MKQPPLRTLLPQRILLPVQEFIQTEVAGGIVLLVAAAVALIWANSPWNDSYFDLWRDTQISVDFHIFSASEDLQHWANDLLMVVFFFVVGLEIKRELLHGELAGPRKAALPAAAALGGMAVPALIYIALNTGENSVDGWGIPMATDIAFALGVLALVGKRIPSRLRVFLLALAVVDDIGAIVVIAVFYTDTLALDSLGIAAAVVALIVVLQAFGVRGTMLYLLLGLCLWAAVYQSGVHATIAGVILGLLTPAQARIDPATYAASMDDLLRDYRQATEDSDEERREATLGEIEELTTGRSAPLERLERLLHPWSSFVVIPIFALANAGIDLSGGVLSDAATSSVTYGVALGLIAGKLAGVLGVTWLAVRLRLADLPAGVTWPHLLGVALLAGIGFTVSLFISGLAFERAELVDEAKIGVFAASIVAGAAGFAFLRILTRPGAGGEPA